MRSFFCILASIVVAALAPDCAGDSAVKTTTVNIRIKVGDKQFTATLEDNATAQTFKAKLPMTVEMVELNGNEKYFRFPNNLPSKAVNPGTIQNGDLMIYGQNTLVLFYKSFPTSYSYTRLGRINDPAGLAEAVGTGDVKVTYELQDKKGD